MGRTVASFRIVIPEEKKEWKPFRDALDKSERKLFDEMWDIPRLYVSACSNSCQLVPLQPIIISILFHHYKELKECIREVEEIINAKGDVETEKNDDMKYSTPQEDEEEEEEEATPATLDSLL